MRFFLADPKDKVTDAEVAVAKQIDDLKPRAAALVETILDDGKYTIAIQFRSGGQLHAKETAAAAPKDFAARAALRLVALNDGLVFLTKRKPKPVPPKTPAKPS